ncbi:hypothetical protein ANN_20091 [Periplaneta americana]|uniref:Uncharacterized protein n=1 Tax=Periplaneta americana TaxID=6978 RepID=A0ABQ8SBX9_PERAM|nr:hypothetical protein ANN_20091 [Periplaneta americana]
MILYVSSSAVTVVTGTTLKVRGSVRKAVILYVSSSAVSVVIGTKIKVRGSVRKGVILHVSSSAVTVVTGTTLKNIICKKLDGCKCVLPDGIGIRLTPLFEEIQC